jgi:hypothetical protein
VGDDLSPDQNISGSGFFQAGDHTQQRGFATSRWTQQNKEFFLTADHVHAVDRLYLTEVFEQTLRFYLGQRILLLVAGYLIQSFFQKRAPIEATEMRLAGAVLFWQHRSGQMKIQQL